MDNNEIQAWNAFDKYSTDIDTGLTMPQLMAFCDIESSFNPKAYRFEPRLRDASYGIMQVLYGTAKWLGFKGDPNNLYNVDTCIRYGMILLERNRQIMRDHLKREPTTAELVASYNAGAGNVLHGFTDNGYVLAWTKAEEKWSSILNER